VDLIPDPILTRQWRPESPVRQCNESGAWPLPLLGFAATPRAGVVAPLVPRIVAGPCALVQKRCNLRSGSCVPANPCKLLPATSTRPDPGSILSQFLDSFWSKICSRNGPNSEQLLVQNLLKKWSKFGAAFGPKSAQEMVQILDSFWQNLFKKWSKFGAAFGPKSAQEM
jgi:hypothetical protein